MTEHEQKEKKSEHLVVDGADDVKNEETGALEAVGNGGRAMPHAGNLLDDKLQILSLIGKGGTSAVYKVRHLILNRLVAVKVMHSHFAEVNEAVQRFQKEAKAAFALKHEHIVSVHDIGTTSDGLPYLLMDYVEGHSLADALSSGPLDCTRALEIFRQICAGLKAAHLKGVVHRDIKPSNVLLTTDGDGKEVAKITDFGIAKVMADEGDQIQKLTQTGEIFGSPLYMSPEQCLGRPVDQRSDIYSLGCLMYECLTGNPPFVGSTPFETLTKHVSESAKPAKAPGLPAAIMHIVLRCLEKRPEDRYQSIAEVEKDLSEPDAKRLAKRPKRPLKLTFKNVFAIVSLSVTIGVTLAIGSFWNVIQFFLFPQPWHVLARQAAAQQTLGPGNYDTARSLMMRAIDKANAGGASDWDKERLYEQLGKLCSASQDWNGAVKYLSLALALNEKHAPDFPTASMHDWLSAAYIEQGNYEKAVRHAETAVKMKMSTLGNHEYTLFAMLHLADAYRGQGRAKEAEAIDRKALAMAQELYPDGHGISLADTYYQLGHILAEQGKTEEAIDNFKHAIAISIKCRGTDHPTTLRRRDEIVGYMKRNGRQSQAAQLMKMFEAE
ncbi:MAG TPA: serine/threonine-protein kinase [Candidatus Obscuribacterales bacterium]